jgi:hypothetical protein
MLQIRSLFWRRFLSFTFWSFSFTFICKSFDNLGHFIVICISIVLIDLVIMLRFSKHFNVTRVKLDRSLVWLKYLLTHCIDIASLGVLVICVNLNRIWTICCNLEPCSYHLLLILVQSYIRCLSLKSFLFIYLFLIFQVS